MKYLKLRLDFKYAEKGRFYRVVLVRRGLSLRTLGCYLVEALGGTLEHMFLYWDKNIQYIDESRMDEDSIFGSIHSIIERDYTKYTIDDLPQHFEFDYDTGDGYDFNVTKYKREVELDDEEYEDIPLVILEGKGQGIWEDHIGTLYALFNGELDPNSIDPNEEEGYYPPWNYKIEKYGDFDNELNIEEENERLSFIDYFDADLF